MKRVWMVAAENDALPRGKVGGVADVVRDLPVALSDLGIKVSVLTPSYGVFHRLPGAVLHRKIRVGFARRSWVVHIYLVPAGDARVEQFVFEHRLFSPQGPGKIYNRDPPGNPYATDSAKFAFFNAAVAAWVNDCDSPPDILHLNDWHTGLIPAFRYLGNNEAPLARVRIVFTIHNLAYQGIRPLRNHPASLEVWFPAWLEQDDMLRDPRYRDCCNFMATAIRLSEAINAVSPGYAQEIQLPSDDATGFSGGEGLERLLALASRQGRLTGILNGCMYPETSAPAPGWQEILELIAQHRRIFYAGRPARDWLEHWKSNRPGEVLLSIGRVVDQKVPLFLEPVKSHPTALQAILEGLGPGSLFIMLGNGDERLEEQLVDIAAKTNNFLFLRGYAELLSAPLYSSADLFLMPSSFEPCGISQMLSMREGCPCVVHAVGGLKDTVEHGRTGFVFEGSTMTEKASNFVQCVLDAVSLKREKPSQWRKICSNAAAIRFSWPRAAKRYMETLYQND
jgi:starch synthase